MKKFVILFVLLSCFNLAVMAEDTNIQPTVNMTPKSNFSGYTNTGTRNIYPKINTNATRANNARAEFMKPRSVRQMAGDVDLTTDTSVPMTFQQFPQHADSSNMFYNQGLGALQNVNMGF